MRTMIWTAALLGSAAAVACANTQPGAETAPGTGAPAAGQPQAVADALPCQQGLHRDGIGLHAEETVQRREPIIQRIG